MLIKSAKIGLSRIVPAGSRAKKQHRFDSDFDVIFAVVGNPSREEFYPILIEILSNNFPYDDVYPVSSYKLFI